MLKKKRFIPQLSDVTPSNEDFASLLESVSTSHVKEGMVVKGQVVEANSDVIVVDVGLKNEGRIAISEFQTIANQELPKVGDIVDVFELIE
jgi:small subunit ribosomal protein S1